MIRSLTVAALGVALSGCVHAFECTVHGGDEVRELTTDHFVVTSDLPLKEHLAEANSLELLWDTFAAFFRAEVPTARIPVVVLPDTSTVESFASGYAGFVVRRGPTALVVGAPTEKGASNTNAHELTHLVSAFMLPRQPRWVAEGLGTYFEDATFKDARTVKMGGWNKGRAEEAFVTGVLPLEELNQWGGLRFDERETRFYASAWAWIHYLSNQDEARLQRLFEGLRGTRPIDQVMAEVFPPAETKALRDKVQAYLGAAKFRGWETVLRRTPTVGSPTVLEPWRVHLLRSRLFLNNEAAAQKNLSMAVELAPTPRPAAVAVVEAALQKTPAKALLDAYPTAPEVLIAADDDDSKLRRPQLTQALQAAPTDAELLMVAADAALNADAPDEAEALALRGMALAPWSSQLATLLVYASANRNRCDEADVRWSSAVALLPERQTEQNTRFIAGVREVLSKCRERQKAAQPAP
jgi:hypothetical protein